jgi:hypothetical protein
VQGSTAGAGPATLNCHGKWSAAEYTLRIDLHQTRRLDTQICTTRSRAIAFISDDCVPGAVVDNEPAARCAGMERLKQLNGIADADTTRLPMRIIAALAQFPLPRFQSAKSRYIKATVQASALLHRGSRINPENA